MHPPRRRGHHRTTPALRPKRARSRRRLPARWVTWPSALASPPPCEGALVRVRAAGGADAATDFAGTLEDPDADDQRSSTSLMAPAGQRRSADDLRRRQAKNRVRQNARRKRG